MPKNYDYEVHLGLKHHEGPAKYDLNTGEFTTIEKKKKLPDGKKMYITTNFAKTNCEDELRRYIKDVFNAHEKSIIFEMILMSEYETNALKPLNNNTTLKELSETFKVGINQVKKYFDHLFKMGIYAQFKIYEEDRKEYWILNPILSFKGKTGKENLEKNFKNTKISQHLENFNKLK